MPRRRDCVNICFACACASVGVCFDCFAHGLAASCERCAPSSEHFVAFFQHFMAISQHFVAISQHFQQRSGMKRALP